MRLNCLTYNLYFGYNAYERLTEYLDNHRNTISKIFILTDENTLEKCYPIFMKNMLLDEVEILEIQAGEIHKNIETCVMLWETMLELGADRKSLLINLGGGVITDIGGFIASCFMRGIPFINIPTTLLSQVDASIGGKTGVDLGLKKNLIGSFSYPEMVIIDTTYLETLLQRELKSGYAEMLKHGLIQDKNHWETLIYAYDNLDFNQLNNLIYDSIKIKKKVVETDPKEAGLRKILNFGHSIGHALESSLLQTENPLLHGEAVVIGMICEAYLATKITNLSKTACDSIKKNLLKIYGNPISNINHEIVLEYLNYDKKNEANTIQMALISEIGQCEYNCIVTTKLVKESLDYYFTTDNE